MLDATGSIGLEAGHNYADLATFSSCKGLFGLTGGAFVAFNSFPNNMINQFNMNIHNHLNKKMSINLDSNKTEVLVKIEDYNGELIFYENFFTEELHKKVFNLKEKYGRIITTVEYDNKTFVNKFVL